MPYHAKYNRQRSHALVSRVQHDRRKTKQAIPCQFSAQVPYSNTIPKNPARERPIRKIQQRQENSKEKLKSGIKVVTAPDSVYLRSPRAEKSIKLKRGTQKEKMGNVRALKHIRGNSNTRR
ncbi:hypothetical protein ASPTUDRAFT_864543 [Aspergillus tubingensis CBS 134.48]|uniref:Uncharacterized protein n=1 Tax=Aspergillus tubingensis (strain CBS 134.48) TaxID=767770 RepID=A0A1L9MUR3_ASPTC|nr:hypothetical protein ASPTUDRAFT_864543 [Aspergillus tubingensis CBS 134.48]